MNIKPFSEPDPQYWQWQGWKIHFVQKGDRGPRVLLIHGFGASTDHFRKNIDVLSQTYQVWAMDLLGFGRSEKPKTVYTGELWRDQLTAFCQEVIQAPVFVAGNSLGGYATLCFAVDQPRWVQGLMLLNCAGPFSTEPTTPPSPFQRMRSQITRSLFKLPGVIEILSFGLFHYTRRRSQIRKILNQVYKDSSAVTDQLVEDIYRPAFDQGALGVFSAVFKSPPGRKLDQLLESLTVPLVLIWGKEDPWMSAQKAEKFREYYPEADLIFIDAGHCPHDEQPEAVNRAIADWIQKQTQQAKVPATPA